MSHSSVRKDVAQRKSMNECSEMTRISPAQGEGSNGPCVGSMSIGLELRTSGLNAKNTFHCWLYSV